MAQHLSEFDGPPVFSTGFLKSESVLQEADRITQERGEVYGPPIENHSCTAELVLAYLKRKYGTASFDAEDVCWFNVLQKISREANQSKRDNRVDIAGFVKNLDEVRRALGYKDGEGQ